MEASQQVTLTARQSGKPVPRGDNALNSASLAEKITETASASPSQTGRARRSPDDRTAGASRDAAAASSRNSQSTPSPENPRPATATTRAGLWLMDPAHRSGQQGARPCIPTNSEAPRRRNASAAHNRPESHSRRLRGRAMRRSRCRATCWWSPKPTCAIRACHHMRAIKSDSPVHPH